MTRLFTSPSPGIHGTIPSSLKNLSKLRELRLYEVNITGTVPEWLGELPVLNILHLGGVVKTSALVASNVPGYTGTIPSSLGDLKQLVFLYIYASSLTGTIPESLINCTTLEMLLLFQNRGPDKVGLSGTIPSWLLRMPSLRQLELEENSFTGTLNGLSAWNRASQLAHLQERFQSRWGTPLGISLTSVIISVSLALSPTKCLRVLE